MRISTPLFYQQGIDAIVSQQSGMLHNQQQIATGRNLLTAADNPIAAAQSLVVRQAKADNDRLASNIGSARDALSQNDSALGSITDLLQSVRTTVVNAAAGTLSASDRAALATDVANRLEELVGLANSRDSNGKFMFSGFQSDSQPFSGGGASPVTYSGDQGARTLQVSAARYLNIAQNGSALFETIRNGNGTFQVSPDVANTGTGVIGSTSVSNPAAVTGNTYALQFNIAGGVTTYDVVDVTTSTTVSTGNAYTDGAPIIVAGMRLAIAGAPQSGDQFTVAPAAPQSMFATLSNLISTLRSPAGTAAERATYLNGTNNALQNVQNALDHVLTARSDVGASLRELDALSSVSEDRTIQYQQTMSRLEDLDYNRALSLFAQQQVALEAAQKSFVKMSGLSLFAYL
ncbi:MAG: flagellar hook-associated protein FlgL [Casimicrobiaceae bacterium]